MEAVTVMQRAAAVLDRQVKWHEAYATMLKRDGGGDRHQDNIAAMMAEARACQTSADQLTLLIGHGRQNDQQPKS